MNQPRIERVLEIMMLLTTNHYYTVEQLAKHFDTSCRTIYRYIDTLKSAGFIVRKSNNVYKIDKSSPYFKDISELVHFTEEEAYILKSAIESIDENNLLKQNLKKKLYSVYNYKIVADMVVNPQNRDNIHYLIDAIEQKKQVKFINYNSAHSNSVRTRLVEPFSFTTNYVQVWCYEIDSHSVKLFKVTRIGKIEVCDASWNYEELHQTGFLDIFRIHSSKRLPIKLELTVRAANLLMEEYPLSQKYLTKIDDNRWILATDVSNYEGVGRFILGLYDDVKIVDSPELSAFIRHRIQKMME